MQRWCCRWIQGQEGRAACPGHPQPRCWGTPRAWVRLLRRGRRIQAAACGAGPSRCGAKPPAVLWGGCRSTGILQRGLRTQAQFDRQHRDGPWTPLPNSDPIQPQPRIPKTPGLLYWGGPTHPAALPAPGCCCAQGALLPLLSQDRIQSRTVPASCTVGSWPHSHPTELGRGCTAHACREPKGSWGTQPLRGAMGREALPTRMGVWRVLHGWFWHSPSPRLTAPSGCAELLALRTRLG